RDCGDEALVAREGLQDVDQSHGRPRQRRGHGERHPPVRADIVGPPDTAERVLSRWRCGHDRLVGPSDAATVRGDMCWSLSPEVSRPRTTIRLLRTRPMNAPSMPVTRAAIAPTRLIAPMTS